MSTAKGVNNASGTEFVPGISVLYDSRVFVFGASIETALPLQMCPVDADYMPMMKMKLLAGRHLEPQDVPAEGSNTIRIIVNKSTAELFGFTPESAVGRVLSAQRGDNRIDHEVIGVVEDFHQTGLHNKILPTSFYVQRGDGYGYLVLDVETSNLRETIEAAQSVWGNIVPGTPFEFSFLDDSIQQLYNADRQTAVLINSFSTIAIVISCLGLYALSAFMAERRFKEIGIRKVMGASVSQVVVMMSSEYVKLVAISLVVSIPLAWIAFDRWLQTFAYRIDIDYSIFVYAGFFAICVALFTVCFETFKAANTSPVNSLKGD